MITFLLCCGVVTASIMFAIIQLSELFKLQEAFRDAKLLFTDVDKAKGKLQSTRKKYTELQKQYSSMRRTLTEIYETISEYEVSVGTVDSVAYIRTYKQRDLEFLEARLSSVKASAKSMVSDKVACVCKMADHIVVNGKKSEAKKLFNREIKLRLRCFDNEIKAAIALANWNNINRLISRVNRVCDEINDKGKIVKTHIQKKYRETKIEELTLSYEIDQLKAEIKESEREERQAAREAEREEGRIKRALERATTEREKMEKLVASELAKLDSTNQLQKEMLELHRQELAILKDRETRAISMAQVTRAGYVYVISNKISFGDEIVKIGMTRRVEPLERVRELGDASVPDTFDVHALIYSEDAPSLESALHAEFDDKRVNLVNRRKEFFMVTPREVIDKAKTIKVHSEITFESID